MEERLLKSYIEEMQKGNMEYFNAFYEETKKAVFYNIFALTKSHETSEDLLHDTYVKFLKEIKNIDLNKSIGGYLMMISKNITLDYFKKNNRIELNDEEGNVVQFEFLDLVELDGEEYVVLLPVVGDGEEGDGEVVILKLESTDEEAGEESYVGVDDEQILNKVFQIFKEKYKDEFNFMDED